MKIIYKYPIDTETILLPVGAEILHIGLQNEIPFIWAIIDHTEEDSEIRLFVFGTGHPLPANPMEFIQTLICMEGKLVIHIFKPI
jgi:hypothetical protein